MYVDTSYTTAQFPCPSEGPGDMTRAGGGCRV